MIEPSQDVSVTQITSDLCDIVTLPAREVTPVTPGYEHDVISQLSEVKDREAYYLGLI